MELPVGSLGWSTHLWDSGNTLHLQQGEMLVCAESVESTDFTKALHSLTMKCEFPL